MVEFAEEYSISASSGAGSLRASERLVRGHQVEVQRAAYLLSGESHAASWLARRTFLAYFERALRDGEGAERREQLICTLATDYLESLTGEERPPPPPRAPMAESEPAHFTVDDQRSRIMNALDRLQPRVRTALVLREFSAIPEETVLRTLNLSVYDLGEGLEPARARLRDAAGIPSDAAIQPLLAQAAIGEPVADIWPDLADEVGRLRARQANRRRTLIAGASLATALLLVAGAIWLLGLNPFSPNEPESRTLAAMPTRDEQPTAPRNTPDAPPPPTPMPEPTMPDIPVGNVPDRLIMTLDVIESLVDSSQAGRQSDDVMFDPVTREFYPGDIPEGLHVPSPDGNSLIVRNYRQDPENDSIDWMELSLVDAETGHRRWTRTFPPFHTWLMSGDSIYAIEWDERPSLMAVHISTGKIRSVQGTLTENMAIDPNQQELRDLRLVASPDGTLLAVIAGYASDGGESYTQIISLYSLPELEFQRTTSQTYVIGPDGRIRDGIVAFFNAAFTPDGSALYSLGNDRVDFLLVGENEPASLEIPFDPPGDGGPIDLRWVTSNDGRYLYAIALGRMEVAVVDLLTQSVELVAPFDPGTFSLLRDTDDTALSFAFANWGAILSPDGEQMYLLGGWRDPRLRLDNAHSSVWVIDIATWRVVDQLVVPGTPTDAMWSHGGQQLIIHSQFQNAADIPHNFGDFSFFDVVTGEEVPGFVDSGSPEWLERLSWVRSFEQVYRDVYGRMPAIDGVQSGTVETVSSLPRVELIPSETLIPAGSTVDFELRILDPSTGQPLASAKPSVRYDPEIVPLVILRQPSSGVEKILVPMRTAPGEYSGVVKIEQEGRWVAEVQIGTGGGAVSRVNVLGLFSVIPSISGDDGELYTPRVQAEPVEPAESGESTIRATFVNVETGDRIREGVDLESGLPESVTIRFTHPDDGWVTATLDPVRHGVYEGKATFLWPGTWEATTSVRSGKTGETVARIRLKPVVIGRSGS